MINIGGLWWGLAEELAAALGEDVTEEMIYRWRDRDGLTVIKIGRTAYSPLAEAARIEAKKGRSRRGRPRTVDK